MSEREPEMVKIAELSTTAYVRAQRKALIHIVAPGDNASHDRAIWEIEYADGSSERISASVKGAVALEEAGYVIRCISEITE
jgi:hypothetical protein